MVSTRKTARRGMVAPGRRRMVTPQEVLYAHFYLHGYVIILLKMAIRPRGRCPCLADAVGVMLIATIRTWLD